MRSKRLLAIVGVAAVMLVGASCTTGGTGFAGLISIDVDGVQSGYVTSCNSGPTDSKLVVQTSNYVYVTYTVNGGPGGEGYTGPSYALPGYGNVFITPFYPSGTCISATIRDVEGFGPFTYAGRWQSTFTPGG